MNDQIPYCPICQRSFLTPGIEGFALSCNHIYCYDCLWQIIDHNEQCYRCYFDDSVTTFSCTRHLANLKKHLEEVIVQLCTVWHNVQLIDQVMQRYFALPFARALIPCKVKQCRNPHCQFDHSGRKYKQRPCVYGDNCPSWTTCILQHPGEVQAFASLPSTPKPGEATPQSSNFSTSPPGYYDLNSSVTYRGPGTLPLYAMPQPPANTGQYSQQCPFCHCYITVCRCQRPNS